MKKIVLFSFMVLVLITACKKSFDQPEDCDSYDYRDCETREPYLSLVSFKFTMNDKIRTVPFVIYKGSVENGQALFYDTARDESIVYYDLEFGKYAVKAEYKVDGKTIYAIDGGEIEKWSNDVCDSVCWGWDSLHLDIRIN